MSIADWVQFGVFVVYVGYNTHMTRKANKQTIKQIQQALYQNRVLTLKKVNDGGGKRIA